METSKQGILLDLIQKGLDKNLEEYHNLRNKVNDEGMTLEDVDAFKKKREELIKGIGEDTVNYIDIMDATWGNP